MPERQEHALNRHLFIADNLSLLRALDNESVDLICIDPPFAKNQTFTGSLRPPLTKEERQRELETLAGWGIRSQRDAENAGIEWPDADNTGRFSDIWRWEDDVHEDWVTRIENDYPALAKVIDATRTTSDEGMAAYLTYMAIRIIEMHRAPLCPDHNIRKNNRRVHLEDYRAEIAYAGEMLVDTTGELIDLAWAYEQALGFYTVRAAAVYHGGG